MIAFNPVFLSANELYFCYFSFARGGHIIRRSVGLKQKHWEKARHIELPFQFPNPFNANRLMYHSIT